MGYATQRFDTDRLNEVWSDLLQAPIPVGTTLSSLCTDTRTLQAGQTFVAVSGEHFDGHDFVETAVNHGATALIVERKQVTVTVVPQIIVSDTRLALARLAAAIRDDFVARGGRVVGLTGSVGKTTNKDMLASIVAQVGRTHATQGNLNNDLGVPFTWLDLPDDAEFAVIEMGANHRGEIAYLAAITRPQVGMVTNAGDAHLGGFGGREGVAKGKGELFSALRRSAHRSVHSTNSTDNLAANTAVINADDDYADDWRGLLADGVAVKTFALRQTDADVYASDISGDGSRFVLHHNAHNAHNATTNATATDAANHRREPVTQVAVTLPTVGEHNVLNALGSAACALVLGVELPQIAAGLAAFVPAKGRLERRQIGQAGALTVIDDTYNANPTAVRAAASIVAQADGYRIMVLGDIAELGDDEIALHAALGKDLIGSADAFFCLGERMAAFANANPDARHFADIDALNDALGEALTTILRQQSQQSRQPTATVLVKGSRSMRMERVVAELEKYVGATG